MWTDETRARYERNGLRYPSDLTDAEWEIVAPLIPPAKRGGRQREVDLRAVVTGLLYVLVMSWKMAANGAPGRRTFRPAARSTAIYNCGLGTARWNASTTHSIFEHANAKTAKRARPPRSSTVNPSDQQKKGGEAAPGRL